VPSYQEVFIFLFPKTNKPFMNDYFEAYIIIDRGSN
jgi:hypothetical protein